MGQLGNRDDAEIIVVDDGSTDDPHTAVRRIGGDKVTFVRNETARGAVPNFNYCLSLASGDLIHLLHGDDLVLPGFYDAMDDAFARGNIAAAFCRTQHIDAQGTPMAVTRSYVHGGGIWDRALMALATSNRISAPSMVITADTFAAIGGFDTSLPHAADWDLWARVAAHGPVHFVDRVLAQYRVHAASDTSARIRTGANMAERYSALEHVLRHVPAELRPRMRRTAATLGAYYALRMTRRQLRAGHLDIAAVQAAWVARSLGRAVAPQGA